MSKFIDEFIQTHKTTGRLRKITTQFRRTQKKETAIINKIMKRFGRR